MNKDYLRIGLVLRPQGVRGELKVQPLTDDPARFRQLEKIWIETTRGEYEERVPLSVSVRDDGVYLSLSGVADRNQAETLRGRYLCVDRAHAVQLPEGRWFVCDLIGCAVRDSAGQQLGKLTDVLQSGPTDVYVVAMPDGRTLMFPALKRLLMQVDTSAKEMVLDAAVLPEVALYED